MKVLCFPSFFFVFHAAIAPVAFCVNSEDRSALSLGKEEVPVSSPWIDLSQLNSNPPQDNGQEGSVQGRKAPKKSKSKSKSSKKGSKSPTDSPMSSPTSPPVSSPIDLACVDVFTGNRTYIPSCAGAVNEIIVQCNSEGNCNYNQYVIEFDSDGNVILDNDTCLLLAEFSYNKVMVKSSQCELQLEPIQLSHVGTCNFPNKGLNYGAPNMLKANIRPDGTMDLFYSRDDGETFFDDVRVATMKNEEGIRKVDPAIFRSAAQCKTLNPAPYQIDELSSGYGPCRNDADCKQVNTDTWCSLDTGDNFPTAYYCYDCLNNNHCIGGQTCETNRNSRSCVNPDINQVRGIAGITTGYDVFDADPLFTAYASGLADQAEDAGAVNRRRFFELEWSSDPKYKVDLPSNKTYYEPIGFEVTAELVMTSQTSVKAFASLDQFSEEQNKALGLGASGTIKGVQLGGSVGIKSKKRIAKDAHKNLVTVTAKSAKQIYRFQIASNKKLKLTLSAEADLKKASSSKDWNDFFRMYGTHLTLGGKVGAWQRQIYSFDENQRSELTTTESTFSESVNIGIPGIFGFDQDSESSKSKEIGKKIQQLQVKQKTYSKGNVKNVYDEAAIIQRRLVPICDHVGEVEGVTKDECQKALIEYCVERIKDTGQITTTKCELSGDEFNFTCLYDNQCPRQETCNLGICTARCKEDSDCGKFEECIDVDNVPSKECHPMKGESEPQKHQCKYENNDTLWVGCQYKNVHCPSGYQEVERKGFPTCFWMPQKKVKCVKIGHHIPPCDRPLKGSCGQGHIGNGCCANGQNCSIWGHCGTDPQVFQPSKQQCEEMGARA